MKLIKKLLKRIVETIFCLFPIKNNKILFDNFYGKGYGESPKYIAEEFHNKHPDLKLFWLSNNPKDSFPEYINVVSTHGIKKFYNFSTSKVIINNVRGLYGFKKRKGQIYLQTWHGGYGPKKIEGEVEEILDPVYVRTAKYDGKITDAILAGTELTENQFKNSFWLNPNCEILKFGLPRNDFLINNKDNQSLIGDIRKKLLGEQKYDNIIILYAPTFRDDGSTDGYKIDFTKLLDAFERKLQKKCTILIKLHPNVENADKLFKVSNAIKNMSSYRDTQELLLVSDYIISDYSSIIFDAALLKKICFICALDIEEYKKNGRLSDSIYSYPFPISFSNDELVKQVENFDQNKYNMDINDFFKTHQFFDKGNAAEQTCNWIMKNINKV